MNDTQAIERSAAISAGAAFRERLENDAALRSAVAIARERWIAFAEALQREIESPEFQTQEARAREFIDEILAPIRKIEKIDDSLEELRWLGRIAGMTEEQIGKSTESEIWNKLLAWHANKQADGRSHAKALGEIQAKRDSENGDNHEFYESDNSPDFRWPPFSGSRDWKNWGVGRDELGNWHLFHCCVYRGGQLYNNWKHHPSLRVDIAGRQDEAAQRFIQYQVFMLRENETHRQWRHVISRVGKAIKNAAALVGHKPEKDPQGRYENGKWIPLICFGSAENTKDGWKFIRYINQSSPRDPRERGKLGKPVGPAAVERGRTGRAIPVYDDDD